MRWLVDVTLVVMISGSICGLASFGWITVLTVQGYVRQRREMNSEKSQPLTAEVVAAHVVARMTTNVRSQEQTDQAAAKFLYWGGWSCQDIANHMVRDIATVQAWRDEARWDEPVRTAADA